MPRPLVALVLVGISIAVAACKKEPARIDPVPSASGSAAPLASATASASPSAIASAAPAKTAQPYGSPALRPAVSATCARYAAQAKALAFPPTLAVPISAYVTTLPGKCIPTASGGWTFRATEFSTNTNGQFGLRMELVHLDADGKLDGVIAVPTMETGLTPRQNCCDVYGATDITVTPVADYDADGEAELYVGAIQAGDEGHHDEKHAIYTFHGHTIAQLPATKGLPLVGVRDADGDGLPDLELAYFAALPEGACTGFTHLVRGPLLLGHALPDGTFSLVDGTARAAARVVCPAKPTTLADTSVACARVWGVSQTAIKAALDKTTRECRVKHPALGADAGCDEIENDPCHEDDVGRSFAKVAAPLDLSAAP